MDTNKQLDLLVVDDDDEFRGTVVRRFVRRGFHVHEASSGPQALELAQRRHFQVALLDMVMPEMSGLELLGHLKEQQSDCEVILLTGQGTIETAVEAMKRGAFHYLTKPAPLSELEVLIERAVEKQKLSKENVQLREIVRRSEQKFDMIGESPSMQQVFRIIHRAGPTDNAILIQGESGTGKELVARALHKASHRNKQPLVVFNCAALPETLMESELFGHERGAFTGATSTKLGLFEVADNGTLMIDEIGEMPGSLQAKLLRVLEDGSLRRIGSTKERRVDVRVLAATNRNLAEEVEAGRFREDLYYRINVMSLELPPLRQRAHDLDLLVEHFLGEGWSIDPDAMNALRQYNWPGNVRQLMNAIGRAKIMADGNTIRVFDLPPDVTGSSARPLRSGAPATDKLSAIERSHIVSVLQRERGNKARSARALGINRRSLYRLVEKYNITQEEIENSNGNGNGHSNGNGNGHSNVNGQTSVGGKVS